MLTKKNLLQIKNHGLTQKTVLNQIQIFSNGIPFTDVVEPAAAGNGIEILSESEQNQLVAIFEEKKNSLELLKFIPASGAATRMFKFLNAFLEDFDSEKDKLKDFLKKDVNLKTFFERSNDFAFANQVYQKLGENYPNYGSWPKEERYPAFVKAMLSAEGLKYNKTPKGLIPFHKYPEGAATAFEEQLLEAAYYINSNGKARLHFTISKEHEVKFRLEFKEIQQKLEEKTELKFEVSYSFQKEKTDTIAATEDNKPFLDEKGDVIFRPAGHGALIENLNEVDADIIFIKNIDNVISAQYVEGIAFQKKMLAGKLLELQEKIFEFIKQLQTAKVSEERLNIIAEFLQKELGIQNIQKDKKAILDILERPIRVCGVVKNTGAPGGGPFRIIKDGKTSLQIVESAQIDMNNEQQKDLATKATHFNPVDLVCGVRNWKGEKFDLMKFTDPDAGFISLKSHLGKPLKALELPGLWNGAMANWNTVFVEVPLITFNPVKTVNDLLNKEHQP